MTESRSDARIAGVRAVTGSGRWGAAVHAAAPRRPPRAASAWRWWFVVALAFVALIALLLGLIQFDTERGGVAAATIPSVPTAVIPGAGAAAAPTAPVAGSLTAGAASLFAVARAGAGGLAALTGQTAVGHAVPVQAVPANEGFWIGSGTADRVWVQFTSGRESTITITPGQLLDLRGPVVPHGPDFARKAGVAAADGADQLTRQGVHLEVDPAQVTVVGAVVGAAVGAAVGTAGPTPTATATGAPARAG